MAGVVKVDDIVVTRPLVLGILGNEESFAQVVRVNVDMYGPERRRQGWFQAEVLFLTGPSVGVVQRCSHIRMRKASLLEVLALTAAAD